MPFDAQAVVDSISRVGLAPGSTSIVPAGFKPTTELSVVYAGGKALALGNLFRKSDCGEAPKVSFPPEVRSITGLPSIFLVRQEAKSRELTPSQALGLTHLEDLHTAPGRSGRAVPQRPEVRQLATLGRDGAKAGGGGGVRR
jgi:hypothetical protein